MRLLLLVVFIPSLVCGEEPGLELVPGAGTPQPYIGISWSGVGDAPADSGYGQGVKLQVVTGPAEAAGLQVGDLLLRVGENRLDADGVPNGDVIRQTTAQAKVGDELAFVVARGEEVSEIVVTLGARPAPFDAYVTPAVWFDPVPERDPEIEALLQSAAAAATVEADYADALTRLRRTEERCDPFRLRDVARAHAFPGATEAIGARIAAQADSDPLGAAARVLVPWVEVPPAPPVELPETLDAAVSLIARTLEAAEALRAQAFAGISADEVAQLQRLFPALGSRLEETVYVHDDPDTEREAANRTLIALAARVRLEPLLRAARLLEPLTTPTMVAALAEQAAAHPQADAATILRQDSAAGPIVFSGRARNTYDGESFAFLFDLGGNDRYRDCGAAARIGTRPIAISIDWAGHDLYAATSEAALAAAVGGISMLVDCAGDDQYLARRWGPAAAVMGVSILDDRAGDDIYRVPELGMGIAFVGAALLLDSAGDDEYASSHLAQGVGLGRGLGALVDRDGNDRYACTGRRPSSYGTKGVFDGWGQGLGMGFRLVTSGGVGVLRDGAGDDRYEGGNFSQGGGYFFGMGILEDVAGADRYIGSRYSQGFAAHQAVGVMIERAGDDLYMSHHEVAHGLSWDETTVVLHDYAGDDTYEASGFSMCRVAHNGVCLVLDDEGDDTYGHRGSPAGSSGNDYHGGTSFGLFVDAGGGNDRYQGQAANDSFGARKEHAVFLDLPGGRDEIRWPALIRRNVFRPRDE